MLPEKDKTYENLKQRVLEDAEYVFRDNGKRSNVENRAFQVRRLNNPYPRKYKIIEIINIVKINVINMKINNLIPNSSEIVR